MQDSGIGFQKVNDGINSLLEVLHIPVQLFEE